MTYPEYIERLEDVLRRKPTGDTSHREWITKYWELMKAASQSDTIFDNKDSRVSGTPKEIEEFWQMYSIVKRRYSKMRVKRD